MTLTFEEKREIFEQMRDGKFEPSDPSDCYDDRNQFADNIGTRQFGLGDHATFVVDRLITHVVDTLGVGRDSIEFLAHMEAAIGDRVTAYDYPKEFELLYWLDLFGRGSTYDYKSHNPQRSNAIRRLREALAWQIVEKEEGLEKKVVAF